MIRRATLTLNYVTATKMVKLTELIDAYLCFMQKCINTLWNHKVFEGSFVPKNYYHHIRTALTERYKQCAAKQALQNVKSQRTRATKTKPVIRRATLELDQRFVHIEEGHNAFDL